MPQTLTDTADRRAGTAGTAGADLIAAVAAMSKEERRARLDRALRVIAAAEGEVLALVGEVEPEPGLPRRRGDLDGGLVGGALRGLGGDVPGPMCTWARRPPRLPHLVGSLCAGEVSFDKVRVLADVATPETDRELCDQAKECTVRELADIARSAGELAQGLFAGSGSRSEHERRYLRFNDEHRTISVQLPRETYAQTRARIEALAEEIPSEGETPWDQRRADGFMTS